VEARALEAGERRLADLPPPRLESLLIDRPHAALARPARHTTGVDKAAPWDYENDRSLF
jgi:hypothetical protein